MHDEHRSPLQRNALEGPKDEPARLACLEKLVGSRPKIAEFHDGVGYFPLPLPDVVGGDSECDTEEVRSEWSRRVVPVPRLVKDNEHFMRQILDVIAVDPQPPQSPHEVVEVCLEGRETRMVCLPTGGFGARLGFG
jgi:hypothetical protein